MFKKVLNKWETEGNMAVIYRIDNIIVFYKKSEDPEFSRNQVVSREEVENSCPYKATLFDEYAIPNDAYPVLTFAWQ